MITDVLDMPTAFIALVVTIALLAGSIGVMRIMPQFLSESAIITCIGEIKYLEIQESG